MRARTVAVAVLLILAGCSGGTPTSSPTPTDEPAGTATPTPTGTAAPTATASPTPSAAPTPTATPVPTPTASPTATASPTPSPTPTASPTATAARYTEAGTPTPTREFDNPWEEEEIVVAYEAEPNVSRDYRQPVAQALTYWRENDERYGNYTVDTVFRPNATNADVVVSVEENVTFCGNVVHTELFIVGCAPILRTNLTAGAQETVQIEAGYSDRATYDIARHEFGHLYGLNHSQEPQDVMNSTQLYERVPTPNVRNQSWAWSTTEFTYYVNYTAAESRRASTLQELNRTLRYYEQGAEGALPRNVTFTRVDDPSEARIVFNIANDDVPDGISDGVRYGRDIDPDRALEEYTYATITLDRGEETARVISWHAGFWLGYALYVDTEEESWPPAFEPDTEFDDREDWWNDYQSRRRS